MDTPSWLFGLLDLLLVFAAVAGFAWWQLRDLKREQQTTAKTKTKAAATQVERHADAPAPAAQDRQDRR